MADPAGQAYNYYQALSNLQTYTSDLGFNVTLSQPRTAVANLAQGVKRNWSHAILAFCLYASAVTALVSSTYTSNQKKEAELRFNERRRELEAEIARLEAKTLVKEALLRRFELDLANPASKVWLLPRTRKLLQELTALDQPSTGVVIRHTGSYPKAHAVKVGPQPYGGFII